MKRAITLAALAGLVAVGTTLPASASAAPCTFAQGFKALHDAIPDVVGDCLETEVDFSSGGARQYTENGMLQLIVADKDATTLFTADADPSTQYTLTGHSGCRSNLHGVWLPSGVCISITPVIEIPQSAIDAGVSAERICKDGDGRNVFIAPNQCLIHRPNG